MTSGTMTVHRNSDVIERFCSRIYSQKEDEEKRGAVVQAQHRDKSGRRLGWICKK